jgi:hypothetical protein
MLQVSDSFSVNVSRMDGWMDGWLVFSAQHALTESLGDQVTPSPRTESDKNKNRFISRQGIDKSRETCSGATHYNSDLEAKHVIIADVEQVQHITRSAPAHMYYATQEHLPRDKRK